MSKSNTNPDAGANAPATGTNTNPDAGAKSPVSNDMSPETKKEEYEEVFVPKNGKGDDSLFVSVNGKRILIKKGEFVKVPKAHAEVIRNAMKQAAKNDEFIAENTSK